jgi:soluble lytic murein transglycosylase-like protein
MPIAHPTTAQPIRRERNYMGMLLSVLTVTVAAFVASPAPQKYEDPKPAPAPTALETTSVATIFDALSRCSPSMRESERWRIAGTVQQESLKYGYDPLFVAAMIEVESGCKPTARGIHGAVGLIQIRPTTAKAVALETGLPWRGDATLRDGVQNVRLGVRYLWSLEERFSDPHLAIAAYNLGPTRVAQMNRAHARNAQYVRRVLGRYQDLVEYYS